MLVLISPAVAETAQRPTQAACSHEAEPDVVTAISTEADIVLKSGQTVKLAAIRLPEKEVFRQNAVAWLRGKIGAPVVVQGENGLDRWGRRLARIRLADPAEALDLARGLIDEGLALADPGAGDARCPEDFLGAEAVARQRSLGVWVDAVYKPIGAGQADRLRERTGTFVIVEGRVRSVGERPHWTYLNFGGRWAEDFTVVIPKRSWKQMIDRGVDAAALKGQFVRVRGILEAWQGASLTIEIPEMIERVPR